MKVNQKLAEARVRFQERGVKQSGKNSYAGYSYFELADILPITNKLGIELGFVTVVSFTDDIATLEFIDIDTGDKVVFTSPMSTASLKGCHDVQNLGAVQTYIKRYLYQNCFEIVESDVLNKTHNPNETQKTVKPKTNRQDEQEDLQALSTRLGDELGLTKEVKTGLWVKSGKNYKKLVEMLEELKLTQEINEKNIF